MVVLLLVFVISSLSLSLSLSQMNTFSGVHEAKVEFNPPHYDNVTCVVPFDDHIYTGSKDMVGRFWFDS